MLPTDYSSSNVSSGEDSASGTTTYRHSNNPNSRSSQHYLVEGSEDGAQRFVYSPINPEYYSTKQNNCESEGGNYATLYDYVISSSTKSIPVDNGIIHDDSGNNSSGSEQYPASSCTAEFLDDDDLVMIENSRNFNNRNNTIALVNKPLQYQEFLINDVDHSKFETLPNIAHNSSNKYNYKRLKNIENYENSAPTTVAAQVDSESTRIEVIFLFNV